MTIEPQPEKVTLLNVRPRAAIEGGRIAIACRNMDMGAFARTRLKVGGVVTRLDFARADLLIAKVPLGAMSGTITLQVNGQESNSIPCEVGARIAQNLHPVANPVIDGEGNLYVTLSGSRGQKVPVSVYKISPRGILTPFVRDLVNPTGMAFGPDGEMYISSRFDGQVYRVSADGTATVFARKLGLATGIAFDREGYLYVGDREGSIYRVNGEGADSQQRGLMTLPIAEFIRRFLLHVPKPGTKVVRGYGLYAPTKWAALARCREQLGQGPVVRAAVLDWQTACSQRGEDHPERCPVCGRLLVCSGVMPRSSGPPAVAALGESVA